MPGNCWNYSKIHIQLASNVMRFFTSIIILLIIGAGTSCIGHASNLKVVFATGEWPPYTSEKVPGYGYATEVVTAACNAVGIEPEYRFYPWTRAEVMVKNGDVFAAFPFMKTEKRGMQYLLSESLLEGENHFVYYNKNTRTQKEVEYKEIADLKKYTIGVIRGDSFEKEMIGLGMKTTPSNTPDLCIKMLRNGRVDFYIGEIVSIIEMTRRLYPDEVSNFKFLPHVYDGKKQNTLIVSKKFPDAKLILDRFNKGVKIIKENGVYEKIKRKYIP